MTVAQITYNKLITNSWTNIYTYLNTRSNISDPRDPQANSKRTFVYDTDPFPQAYDFNLYPYIVIELPKVNSPIENMSADGKFKTVYWTHRIIVRTIKEGASNSSYDVGKTDMMNIADQLHALFNSMSFKQTLKNLYHEYVEFEETNNDSVNIEGRTLYEKEFELRYKRRIRVSA